MGVSDGRRFCVHLWWLILCANLTWPREVKYLVNHLLWVCLWGCFWMRLAFELVDWIAQITLPNVGRPQLISRRPKLKRLKNREFLLPDCPELGHHFFPPFDSYAKWNISSSILQAGCLNHPLSWFLGLQAQTELPYQLSWISSLLNVLRSCSPSYMCKGIASVLDSNLSSVVY